ncbi:transcriptional regulator with XRE-family HTH domain [Aureimonas pseudogalii]|uniref:Transcriptional regulator with XRE-family HTH domain n=2 Tax=Aureimonas pseudogalii TaxID=1744844 RepID=A0A7W6EBL8_9HYPH|nr:transcriptional regulator with XRE-family HTH domain [Aureimonas pseudogalii]
MLGISQTRLCELLGFSRNLVNEFESGSHIPRAGNVARIREVLEAEGVVFVDLGNGSSAVGVLRDVRSGGGKPA